MAMGRRKPRQESLFVLTADFARGLINAHSVPAASFAQSWSLDATGNWARFQQTEPAGGASQNFLQSCESNRANEVVDIAATYGPSWFVPVYDRAGNMIGLPRPESPANHRAAGYDAWNRLVTVNVGTWTYAYDALHRRITSTAGSNQRHYYYSSQWQVLEERLGANPDTAPAERQFVWGLRYLDDCVLRDRSPTNNGVLSERLYALQDANWNVTSLISPAGAVQERYRYAAYGQPTFLSAAFAPLAPNASAFDWETLYCGYRYDRSTGLYQVRHRYLHPGLGCWLTRDSLGRLVWTLMLTGYRYANNSPANLVDWTGLRVVHEGNPSQSDKDLFIQVLEELAEDELTYAGCLARKALSPRFTLVVKWRRGTKPQGKLHPIAERAEAELYLPPGDPDYVPPSMSLVDLALDLDPDPLRRLIVVAHELGHAVGGLNDPTSEFPGGGNITLIEAPFRRVYGSQRVRGRYTPNSPPVPDRGGVDRDERINIRRHTTGFGPPTAAIWEEVFGAEGPFAPQSQTPVMQLPPVVIPDPR